MRLCVAFWLVVFALAGAVGPAAAGEPQVERAPAPDWAEILPIPAPNQARLAQVEGGIYYLLADTQVRWAPGSYDSYYRYAYKVVDRSGLEEAAQISLDFDPDSEVLTLHDISVLRDGAVLDRLGEARVDLLRREADLDAGIIDGAITALLTLTDVRVGDVIEYSVSYTVTPIVAPDQFADGFETVYGVPLSLSRYRLIWPAGRPLEIQAAEGAVAPRVTHAGDREIYDWETVDAEPRPGENATPAWRDNGAPVRVSSFRDWAQVADAVRRLLPQDRAMPPDFAAKVDAIAAGARGDGARLAAALRLVQDGIRYVAIELGEGGYVPRPPETVIRRGFGDCKDKSLLLVAVLERLGIHAVVALADLDQGRGIRAHLPSPYVFDHAIVRADTDRGPVWVDPTGSLEGGTPPYADAPDYGDALPLEANATLSALPEDDAATATTTTLEDFAFHADADPALTLTVTSTLTGPDANRFRYNLAGGSKAGLERGYLAYYTQRYPGLTTAAPLAVDDDRSANRIIVTERYALAQAAFAGSGLDGWFPIAPANFGDVLPRPDPAGRRTPVQLAFPFNHVHRIELSGFAHGLAPLAEDSLHEPFASYSLDSGERPDGLWAEWTLHTLAPEVAPDQAAALAAASRQVADSISQQVDLSTLGAGEAMAWDWTSSPLALAGIGFAAILIFWAGFVLGRVSV